MSNLPELYVTLWPTFPHYKRFATDYRLKGLRLNSAMLHADELDRELAIANQVVDSSNKVSTASSTDVPLKKSGFMSV